MTILHYLTKTFTKHFSKATCLLFFSQEKKSTEVAKKVGDTLAKRQN
jgi:hypothetical protein